MTFLAEILCSFIRTNFKYNNTKSKFIFYKIVDSIKDGVFTLQCINTSALFYAKILDIVFDPDLLNGLHPIQSCFIGIEYAKYIKKYDLKSKAPKVNKEQNNLQSLNRYGLYSLCHQNRNGELCFINNITNEQFTMDPRDIAFSEEIITEFDSTQAFHVGLLTGLKINNTNKINKDPLRIKRSKLYLVK